MTTQCTVVVPSIDSNYDHIILLARGRLYQFASNNAPIRLNVSKLIKRKLIIAPKAHYIHSCNHIALRVQFIEAQLKICFVWSG